MSVKIKSILAQQLEPSQLNHTSAISPSRCEMSRLSSGSALKNLSHERYMKKLSKMKDSSQNYQSNSRQLLESLNTLGEQIESIKNQQTCRSSLKKSIQVRGVPHTCITLNPRTSVNKSRDFLRQNSMNTTLHSRKNSFTNNQNSLRVVTIGTECQKKKKVNKKKGITISLRSTKTVIAKLY